MRRLVIALLLAPALASAAPAPKPDHVAPPPPDKRHVNDKAKPIDIKPALDKLDVFKDDVGNYYVSPRPDAMSSDDSQAWVFYGDGKAMYQQRIIGSSQQSGHHFEWYVWAPRAKGMQAALLALDPGGLLVQCRNKDDGKRKLTQLTADEANTFLKRATFYPPLWTRQSHVLLRDDDGVYYFVDELREELGGNGYRVFVGPKGAMKEIPMTNVATDSAGEIFATKAGQLKLVAGSDGKATWIKGGKKTELTRLEPQENRYLIYRELGIYGSLGAICDDL
jgi:hypothetical protein